MFTPYVRGGYIIYRDKKTARIKASPSDPGHVGVSGDKNPAPAAG